MKTHVDNLVHPGHLCTYSRARQGVVRLKNQGFTIVELVTVIVLLGILSVVVIPRLVKPSAFASGLITQGLIAESRMAQQLAMARVDAVVSLLIDNDGNAWRLRINTDVDGQVRARSFDAYNTTLQATSGAATANINAATPVLITFSHSGDIATVDIGGSPGDAAMGVDFLISGDSDRQACLYASGYITDAACS